MKILFFSAYFTPEKFASMYLFEDILKALIDDGNEIVLFCPTPCRGVSNETRKEYKHIRTERRFDGKLTIRRYALYKEPKSSFKRFIRYYISNWIVFFKSLFTKADVIFTSSTPPIVGLTLSKLKFFKRIPIVYDLQDIFPDSLVSTGLSKKDSLLWKIGRKVENKTYKCSDKIVVISEDFKKNIMEKSVPENKITIIPNWADTTGIFKVKRNDNFLFDKYNLDRNLFYISYSGNIGFTQNMDMLLDAAKLLEKQIPDLRFLLVGDGSDKERIGERIHNESIDNVILIPFQEYSCISNVFSLGDVGLIISKAGVGNNSVPSKTWGYMAASTPILASFDLDSQLADIITKVQCGFVASAGSLEAFVNAIKEIYCKKEDLYRVGELGKNYVTKTLNKDFCCQKYVDIIKQACFEKNIKKQ